MDSRRQGQHEAQLLADLAEAVAAEVRARAEVRGATERVTTLVRALQSRGVPSSRIAARVARTKGEPLDLAARKRIASALRQRTSRATRCHEKLSATPSVSRPVELLITSEKEATDMPNKPQVIKRTTVTEEYLDVEAEDLDTDREPEEDGEEAEEIEHESRPLKRRRQS